MTKPDLLQICPYADPIVQALEDDFTLHRYFAAEDKPALLQRLAPTTRFIATDGHHGASKAMIDALPKLELIASFGVGYDAVDVTAAKAAGVSVTNTPNVLNNCVAEVTLGLMLALCHQIPQADRYVRQGRWAAEGNFPLTDELTGRRVGILGLGRIGKAIAKLLQAFQMEVVYHGRNRQEHQPYPYYADLEAMARDVDWLIVIAPGSASTKGIVGRAVMTALGPAGKLVNVARGSLVDEAAMIALLEAGELGGAALDVFAEEPQVPERLRTLDNVVLLPHQGSASHKTRSAMGQMVVRNLKAQLRGEPLISPVV
ncbi:2-hydroxyacid dehydrogenase [Jiella sp. MQZ9-1]|uniref:2-hydroxyacid dehydrogenase n=1 Tax=Jiella flava TaxID=2816857 RepID=A0A939FU05_9HYPH|nr:2-hydroxyacid dehydrogenase [Jiella flava]MBO0661928.1 2-hydroxyacid dehydrogenase [Jiella flava]MCD2470744.1 2-hydroxyacid dehydrogenase [Jiella flava]